MNDQFHKSIVRVTNAMYEEESESVVIYAFFESIGEHRIVKFNKNYWHYKQVGTPPPENELRKLAETFKGTRFTLIIQNDPYMVDVYSLGSDEYQKYVKKFTGTVGEQMTQIMNGLIDDTSQIQRKLGRMMDEGSIQVDPLSLIQNEINMKKKGL